MICTCLFFRTVNCISTAFLNPFLQTHTHTHTHTHRGRNWISPWGLTKCNSRWGRIVTTSQTHDIYIYIYCHPQTDCFVLSELFSVARHVGRSKPRSKPIQLESQTARATSVPPGNFQGIYVETAAAASVSLHFYTLSATRVLNSFEEVCIMRATAENSFARVLNPHERAYIYIYIYIIISCSWLSVTIRPYQPLCYIIAEVFRFMPLILVRLRTFRLSTWVSWV